MHKLNDFQDTLFTFSLLLLLALGSLLALAPLPQEQLLLLLLFMGFEFIDWLKIHVDLIGVIA